MSLFSLPRVKGPSNRTDFLIHYFKRTGKGDVNKSLSKFLDFTVATNAYVLDILYFPLDSNNLEVWSDRLVMRSVWFILEKRLVFGFKNYTSFF